MNMTCSILHMNMETVECGEAVKKQFHVLLKRKEPANTSRTVQRCDRACIFSWVGYLFS
jgi:hypothetical protein